MRGLAVACLAFAVSACFPGKIVRRECTSKCGMELYGSPDCSGFQAAESRAMQYLQPVVMGNLCERMQGVTVRSLAQREPWFLMLDGQKVGGYTVCGYRPSITLAQDDWHTNAFAHEIVHASDCPGGNEYHIGWDIYGVFQAIESAKVP